ncbi:MAG TPA: FHA domain-containing protein [Planctomycetaceae bacterium]|nr:FHA domain-containing protein [Planctomycetaceae bacterium]HQZ68193.1 FHA domain-containing protein [Planctomycetaceae bacterium]
MKVVLELQDQPSNVRRITVRHDIVIGRGTDCNLRLSAPQVSRRHCFLRVGRDSASVTDLDSSNGTFVDGKRITSGKRHDLADGAQLALGPIRFVIHVQGDTVTAEDSKSGGVGAFANSGIRSEAGRSSETPLPVNSTGSTHPDNAVSRTSDLRMNYSLEHGGAAADSDENTSDCLIERRGTQEDVEKFSRADSRFVGIRRQVPA